MSEAKTASQPGTPSGHADSHDHPVDFNSYLRRCGAVLLVALIAIGFMIWTSFLPNVGWTAKVCIILGIATCNAFVVAGFLMHLLSERKMVYTILGFTVSFVIGLFGLTIWAMNDFPKGTFVH